MREYVVSRDEQGQRLDKYLRRRLPLAPSSFIYKMLRKKNITLRGGKADGSEKVEEGDCIRMFLSDETIDKFSGPAGSLTETTGAERTGGPERKKAADEEAEAERRAYEAIRPLLGRSPVLYEDENVLIVQKPAGVLSQKASPSDISMNEWLRGYLRQQEDRQTAAPGFRPTVCNRLDRNTGGILLCAKSLRGSRALSAVIRERIIRKTYQMVVHGRVTKPGTVRTGLQKDRAGNRVSIAVAQDASSNSKALTSAAAEILSGRAKAGEKPGPVRHAETVYRPVRAGHRATLVEADLITGRSHQPRVHMASIGHPILFDPKYGDRALDRPFLRGIRRPQGQLLWCVETAFPDDLCKKTAAAGAGGEEILEVLRPLAGRAFRSPAPAWWQKLYADQ